MNERTFAVSNSGFMDQKKPALWIKDGNSMIKLATFTSDKAKEDFLKLIEENYQGHVVNGFKEG